jgi:hypothetical protein
MVAFSQNVRYKRGTTTTGHCLQGTESDVPTYRGSGRSGRSRAVHQTHETVNPCVTLVTFVVSSYSVHTNTLRSTDSVRHTVRPCQVF